MAFGLGIRAPHGGIWVLPIMGSFVQILLFLVALAVGIAVMATIVIFLKSRDRRLAEVDAVATV
jgi:PTS system fructose-specific IIC component